MEYALKHPVEAPGKRVRQTLLPSGIEAMLGYDREKFLLVRGTPKALAEFREMLPFLDVPPRSVKLTLELVRTTSDAQGKQTRTLVSRPSITTINNQPATLSVMQGRQGFAIEILPRIAEKERLTVRAELRLTRENGSPLSPTVSRMTVVRTPCPLISGLTAPDEGMMPAPDELAAGGFPRTTYSLILAGVQIFPAPKVTSR